MENLHPAAQVVALIMIGFTLSVLIMSASDSWKDLNWKYIKKKNKIKHHAKNNNS